MKVYRAETGKRVSLRSLQAVDSLSALRLELEHATQVPASSQILMTSFGTQLKEEMVVDAVRATGKDECILIIYDRHYLDAPAESIAALTVAETPAMEPQIAPVNGTLLNSLRTKRATSKLALSQHCDLYLGLFRNNDALSQTYLQTTTSHAHLAGDLCAEQRIQHMALNVAQANLDAHARSSAQQHDRFSELSRRDLARQSAVLAGIDADVEALRRVRVHPRVVENMVINGKKGGKDGMTLAEFVDLKEVAEARSRAKSAYEGLVGQTQDLFTTVVGIQQGTEGLKRQGFGDVDLKLVDAKAAEVEEALHKVVEIRDKIQRDLSRVQDKIAELLHHPPFPQPNTSTSTTRSGAQLAPVSAATGFPAPAPLPSHARKTFEAFDHLAEIHMREYLPELERREDQARRGVLYLAQSKARMIDAFARQMKSVSQLQSAIAGIVPTMNTIEGGVKALRREVDEGPCGGVKRVVAAYGALMIELVRRKEYTNILLENASTLADLLAHFRSQEQRRRDTFRSDLGKSLPFGIDGMEDPPPYPEISMPGQRDRLPEIGKDDVKDLLSFLRTTYMPAPPSVDITPSTSSPLSPSAIRRPPSSLDHPRSMSRGGGSGGGPIPPQSQPQTESTGRDKILQTLGRMNRQVEGMRGEFVRGVEKRYFPDRPSSRTVTGDDFSTSRRNSYNSMRDQMNGEASQAGTVGGLVQQSTREVVETDELLFQKSRALETAEERIKNYESRIKSLEDTLHRTYRSTSTLPLPAPQPSRADSPSISSSTYSVVDAAEDANVKTDAAAKAETWRIRCTELERRVEELQKEREREVASAKSEAEERKDEFRTELARERAKADEIQELLERERKAWSEERKMIDTEWEERGREWEERAREWVASAEEKDRTEEDLKAQISELEGLLDEERQTYEENRMSLLREVQTQAHLAERRIADVEVELKDKIRELEQTIERQNNEHAQRVAFHEQMNETQRAEQELQRRGAREEHERAIKSLWDEVEREKETARREVEEVWRERVVEKERAFEEERREWGREKKKHAGDRERLLAEVEALKMQITDKEEIRRRQEQAREMLARAEKNWMEKNEALEKIKEEFKEAKRSVSTLLRITGSTAESTASEEDTLDDLLRRLDDNIAWLLQTRVALEESVRTADDRVAAETKRREEAAALASEVTSQLLAYHHGVVDGLVKGLNLDKEAEGAGKEKVTDKAAEPASTEVDSETRTPEEVLEMTRSLNFDETLEKVKRKVAESRETTKRWYKECKMLKEKYTMVKAEASEKIAFRNFKVGDVALFLPTRNTNGNFPGNPWAAFNFLAPHCFLKQTESAVKAMKTREWIIARILSTTECLVDSNNPGSNPYGLADGLKFYEFEVDTEWQHKSLSLHRSQTASPSSSHKASASNANLMSSSAMMSASSIMSRSQVDSPQTDGQATSPVSPNNSSPPPNVLGRASVPVTTSATSPTVPPISQSNSPYSLNRNSSLAAALPTSPSQHHSVLSASTPSLTRNTNLNNVSPPSSFITNSPAPTTASPRPRSDQFGDWSNSPTMTDF
ncbi:hypothetical protein BC936DRAFT_145122 [Jimgerdemannia flammicorona]|uniref:Autophagy-related protein 11 n=1 Tax=Jimgerdemannia flammicorona TaxID=994334 RepID=A0A433DAV4_9FUNG|nr:hypothetical protein BC936DRAFT_145122 [Jimgerdemannia flammicorona]